jgi:hypothetical protein
MRIFLIMLLALSATVVKADDDLSNAEFLFLNSESQREQAIKNQRKFLTNDYCFKKCGIIIYSYKECRGFAQTVEEKEMCITEGEKICLMECKNEKLDKTGVTERLDKRYNEYLEAEKKEQEKLLAQ